MANLKSTLEILAQRVQDHAATIATEEAAKTSLIMPFLKALGYDVFNPGEVVPEFTADAVGKKGEKVDYAIRLNEKIQMLVECKGLSTELDKKHLSQLFRYFVVTEAKFGVLTNGRIYQFFTDLEEPNKLDARPFFSFDLLDYGAGAIAELEKFSRDAFDVERILANAERLKFVSAAKRFLAEQMDSPSEEMTRLVAANIYEGRVTSHVREMIASATQAAFKELVRESVRARLSSALESDSDHLREEETVQGGIETTEEEIEGWLTIKAIVREVIDTKRVGIRDAKSYCAVLVDDNNRKPLARMHFNRSQWYLGLFDSGEEDRVAIAGLEEIFLYSERLKATAERYRS